MSDNALQGRLADFTLEEILQLIALQQKTGLLTVDASFPMVLGFETGTMVSYRDRRADAGDPLERYLKSYGFFSAENWEHVEYVRQNSKLDLTEILLNEGLLTAEELEAIQEQAAQEHLLRGMQLRDGRYRFVTGRDGIMGTKGRVRLKVDGLLMEAVRRIDEMPGLRERYPSGRVRIRRSAEEVEESQLRAGERRLLAVIGEESLLSRVVDHARMSEFDTLTTLEALRERQLIEVQAPPRAPADPEESAQARRKVIPEGRPWVGPVLAVLSLVLAAALLWLDPLAGYRGEGDRPPHLLRQDEQTLRAALQLRTLDRGRYPRSLQELAEEGWVESDLVERSLRRLRYRTDASGSAYELQTTPDALPGPG